MIWLAKRRHGGFAPALAVSAGLHGAAAMALLAPWPAPTEKTVAPMLVELVAPVAEPPAATAPAPIRPMARPRHRPLHPSPTPRRAAATPLPNPAGEASGVPDDSPPPALSGEKEQPRGGGGAAAGGGTASPPDYTLGSAQTPAPDYPWSARRRGVQGRVVIRLEVDDTGRPTAASLIEGSGDQSLDLAALTALRQWRLRPALTDGRPVASHVVVSILFKLT